MIKLIKETILMKKLFSYLNSVPLFATTNNFIICWDILQCLCLGVFIFAVPLYVAFDMKIG